MILGRSESCWKYLRDTRHWLIKGKGGKLLLNEKINEQEYQSWCQQNSYRCQLYQRSSNSNGK